MKYISTIITGTVLLWSHAVFSQKDDSGKKVVIVNVIDSLKLRHDKLKGLFVKMLDSESNKLTEGYIKAYLKKSNHLKYKDDVKNVRIYLNG